ncbi:MAG: TolC family protein [Elusimicrobia bacterium]|nr:TolC family protein [Elusimicrobiota bacterium]
MTGFWPMSTLGFLLAALPARGEERGAPALSLSLAVAQADALKLSPGLRAAEREREAAEAQARGRRSALWPRLGFDAYWRGVTDVPSVALPVPGSPLLSFGTHESWGVGPNLSWTFWDSKAAWNASRSLEAAARSRRQETAALRRLLLLETRLAYFKVQLALEHARLLADSLRLAQAQHEDVAQRLRYRNASRIDLLSAHQEVLDRLGQLRQARSDLASGVRDLFSKTGAGAGTDPSLPLDARTASGLPQGTEPASLLLELEPLGTSLAALDVRAEEAPDPRLRALEEAAQASRLAARSAGAERWPKLQLTARTGVEYPNGPVRENIHQNALGVSLSLPLFEGWRVAEEVQRHALQARASEERRSQAELDLERDRKQAGDQLAGLRVQQGLSRQAVSETEELARLIYDSYKSGRSTFLEVQSANLRALEAKVRSARTDAETLAQLAVLRSLSSEE